jgi:3-hydroxyacyl-CoA dehydrogenase
MGSRHFTSRAIPWVTFTTGKLALFLLKEPCCSKCCFCSIWAAIKREALLAAAEGAGTPEEIDAIFRGVLKTAKGPFELMDIVGLDVVLDIEQHYASARRDIPSEPQQYLNKFLQNGHLGVKSGRGFYTYDSTQAE